MNICTIKGTHYLVPDRYADPLREKLSSDTQVRPLTDLNELRHGSSVSVLIDDPRFCGRFRARNLDFIQAEQPFPLLASLPDTAQDHSFASLFEEGSTIYDIYNLAEGEAGLHEEDHQQNRGKRLVLCGLGDVGGTMLTGLRLLGDEAVSEILIYDRSESRLQRWYREASQILRPDGAFMPLIRVASREELFTGDAFIFCVSAGVPPVGQESGTDVRMVQLEKNAAILKEYIDQAHADSYQGHFFIVSDPVDQLCMYTFRQGALKSRQIRGFGLGVMYARAMFHAGEAGLASSELRVFGPHGEGLVVLNSLSGYDPNVSAQLTELTRTENLVIRETGYKPYVAPALSSGALSILACLKGQWHYSSTLMDGVWFGAKNRLDGGFTEYELLPLPAPVLNQMTKTRSLLLNSMPKPGLPDEDMPEEDKSHAN